MSGFDATNGTRGARQPGGAMMSWFNKRMAKRIRGGGGKAMGLDPLLLITVGALVAVNAVGDVVDPRSGRVLAGARGDDGRTPLDCMDAIAADRLPEPLLAGMSTTIGVIATDAVLTKAQAGKLASMAHDGLARTVNPAHTIHDGDTLFALATGGSGRSGNMMVLGALAAEVTARAVLNAVCAAQGLAQPPLPSARDLGLA